MPADITTKAEAFEAVRRAGWQPGDVSEAEMTPELCLVAISESGAALERVPPTLRSEAVCLAAVKQAGWALEWVPESLKSPALCRRP